MRALKTIAMEINNEWKKPYFGAVPYIRAMYSLESADSMYGYDSARSIINYFLSNASSWRGDKAKEIKSELKLILNSK